MNWLRHVFWLQRIWRVCIRQQLKWVLYQLLGPIKYHHRYFTSTLDALVIIYLCCWATQLLICASISVNVNKSALVLWPCVFTGHFPPTCVLSMMWDCVPICSHRLELLSSNNHMYWPVSIFCDIGMWYSQTHTYMYSVYQQGCKQELCFLSHDAL